MSSRRARLAAACYEIGRSAPLVAEFGREKNWKSGGGGVVVALSPIQRRSRHTGLPRKRKRERKLLHFSRAAFQFSGARHSAGATCAQPKKVAIDDDDDNSSNNNNSDDDDDDSDSDSHSRNDNDNNNMPPPLSSVTATSENRRPLIAINTDAGRSLRHLDTREHQKQSISSTSAAPVFKHR
jgi:hypothetical protein